MTEENIEQRVANIAAVRSISRDSWGGKGGKFVHDVDFSSYEKRDSNPPRYGFNIPNSKHTTDPDRFVVFELEYKGKYGTPEKKYVLRFSEDAGGSHNHIAGKFAFEEMRELLDLDMDDLIWKQSHHQEPLVLFYKDGVLARAIGGGFIDIDPEKKVVNYHGRSKSMGPDDSIHPAGLHIYAAACLDAALKSQGQDGYTHKIEGLEGVDPRRVLGMARNLYAGMGREADSEIFRVSKIIDQTQKDGGNLGERLMKRD